MSHKNKSCHECSSFPHFNSFLIFHHSIYYAQCQYNQSIVTSLFERFVYYNGNWVFPCTIFNTSFFILAWNLTVISPAVIYIYTIPTSCFIVIVVLVLTSLSDLSQMYPTCSWLFNGIYVAVSIFMIHKMHVALPLCDDGNFIDLHLHLGDLGEWEIPKKLYFCEHFSSEIRGIFM